MALLAVAELWLAGATRARLAGGPGTRPINPMLVARYAALAKATSVVGGVLTGGYAGFLGWVVQRDTPAAHHDTRSASIGIALALLLLTAGLVLEHVCKVPDDDDRPAGGQAG
jgi:hypothetical protein